MRRNPSADDWIESIRARCRETVEELSWGTHQRALQALLLGDPIMGRGPMAVVLSFALERPTRHYKAPPSPALRPGAPQYPTRQDRDDLDNLAKAVLDALGDWRKQGCLLWADDAQVVDLTLRKRYVASPSESPGVKVDVKAIQLRPIKHPAPHRGM